MTGRVELIDRLPHGKYRSTAGLGLVTNSTSILYKKESESIDVVLIATLTLILPSVALTF